VRGKWRQFGYFAAGWGVAAFLFRTIYPWMYADGLQWEQCVVRMVIGGLSLALADILLSLSHKEA
jgi:hypothetical protein